jgi:hypothetical protein
MRTTHRLQPFASWDPGLVGPTIKTEIYGLTHSEANTAGCILTAATEDLKHILLMEGQEDRTRSRTIQFAMYL